MTNMPERVARALCRLDGHPENATMDGKPLWQDYLPEARAAIAEMREPDNITREMELAGIAALDEAYGLLAPHQIVVAVFTAMIDAALGKEE